MSVNELTFEFPFLSASLSVRFCSSEFRVAKYKTQQPIPTVFLSSAQGAVAPI